jgi:hypothetical protein
LQKSAKKTDAELKSEWQDTQVELLKTLHGFEQAGVNEEVGSVDYVAEEGGERKLLRVMVGPKFNASRAFVKTVEETQEDLEEEGYDEVILLAERFTSSSRERVVRDDDFEWITMNRRPHSLTDLANAVQMKTMELCDARCGGYPEREEDCEGYVDGEYTCPVRRVSDDADFHAEMGWLPLLMNDFSRLVEIQRETEC